MLGEIEQGSHLSCPNHPPAYATQGTTPPRLKTQPTEPGHGHSRPSKSEPSRPNQYFQKSQLHVKPSSKGQSENIWVKTQQNTGLLPDVQWLIIHSPKQGGRVPDPWSRKIQHAKEQLTHAPQLSLPATEPVLATWSPTAVRSPWLRTRKGPSSLHWRKLCTEERKTPNINK